MEACAGAHYWAREIAKLGHQVRFLAPAIGYRGFHAAVSAGILVAGYAPFDGLALALSR